jgi:hypothetical protein
VESTSWQGYWVSVYPSSHSSDRVATPVEESDVSYSLLPMNVMAAEFKSGPGWYELVSEPDSLCGCASGHPSNLHCQTV